MPSSQWPEARLTRRALLDMDASHMFVQSDRARDSTSSGEALILRAHGSAEPQVLARLSVSA